MMILFKLKQKQIACQYIQPQFIIYMDNIPSKSISKSILLVTPLFLVVLAVLHSSSQLSYLFILKFINNVAGRADMTFIPTMQPQVSHEQFQRNDIMNQFQIYQSGQVQATNLPLIDIKKLQKWVNTSDIIRGVSPRWMIPAKMGSSDIIVLVLNISKQKNIGIINDNSIPSLDGKQMAVQQQLANKLRYQVGDIGTISIQPKNILNSLKLFQKFSDLGSDQEYKTDIPELSEQQLSKMVGKYIKQYTQSDINDDDFQTVFHQLYNSEVNYQLTMKKKFYPQGIYPSALSNVVIIQYQGLNNIMSQWAINLLLKANTISSIKQLIPPQYQRLIPRNDFESQIISIQIKAILRNAFTMYSLISVCSLNDRQKVYYPQNGIEYDQFTQMLETTPGNMEIITIYPFYQQSLAIKYFFDSVIQIFQFVSCIVYFYTMTLIMKQIYEEKEVEVGIWRTLGAGGVPRRKKQAYEVQMTQNKIQSKGYNLKYRSQFQSSMTFVQKLKFIGQLAYKVGYINYWVLTTTLSLILYFFLKLILYYSICGKLGNSPIMQPLSNIPIIFLIVFTFVQILIYTHINRIFTSPLSQTIKPVKRTFDVVKVRVIHVATFGVSLQVLLIAVMLIYYGVVSYYWIPYAVLINNSNLQVFLFNTIFLFMIFGSIILLSILQSRIQVAIFSIIFRFNSQMRTMKLAILKNIKAKKYKNIKVSIIISIIFAFVLFFTAGIKIQMQIIQSFIERALGSNLVFENYQKNTFNTTLINNILDNQTGIQYSWLSRGLSRDNVSISLLSHISNNYINPQIQVLSPTYLNSTFYQYYYPEDYLPEANQYWKLPNSIRDGFNSIYTGQQGKQSVGKYNTSNTITEADPNNINVDGLHPFGEGLILNRVTMAPEEQVINLVVSSALRNQLGVEVGSFYKMVISNKVENIQYVTRARITHSFKAGPGFDILGRKAFISQQQAAYIYRILKIDEGISEQKQKLFVKGTQQSLKGIGSSIIPVSPEHTQMFEIQFVSQSFLLLSQYLNAYVVLITGIMSTLVTIFIFLYTLGKCREQAEMFKMLRAIGLSAKNIRMMIFSEIIIRLIVSILNGILLGILFSIGFSLQIEEFLMIKTPPMDITIVCVLGIVLTILFSITIIRATRYISQKSVADTNKI